MGGEQRQSKLFKDTDRAEGGIFQRASGQRYLYCKRAPLMTLLLGVYPLRKVTSRGFFHLEGSGVPKQAWPLSYDHPIQTTNRKLQDRSPNQSKVANKEEGRGGELANLV